jgi:hypothetical protein
VIPPWCIVAVARPRVSYGGPPCRHAIDDAVMLVGDAAGVAYAQSGEGIRPAIESGLIAASTIIDAKGRYTRDRLEPYEHRIRRRFGVRSLTRALARAVPAGVPAAVTARRHAEPGFVRYVLRDRWFVHAGVRARCCLSHQAASEAVPGIETPRKAPDIRHRERSCPAWIMRGPLVGRAGRGIAAAPACSRDRQRPALWCDAGASILDALNRSGLVSRRSA